MRSKGSRLSQSSPPAVSASAPSIGSSRKPAANAAARGDPSNPSLPLLRFVDFPERGGADIDVRLFGDRLAQRSNELGRLALEPEKDVGVDEEAHSSPSNRRSISGSGASKSSAMKLIRISFEGLRARFLGPIGASRALATPFLAIMISSPRSAASTSDE